METEKRLNFVNLTRFDYKKPGTPDETLQTEGIKIQSTSFKENGNIIRDVHYNNAGKEEEVIEYKYDGQGNLTEEQLYHAADDFSETRTYERNESGLLLSEKLHYLDGSADETSYLYDEAGNVREKIVRDDEGSIEREERYLWNETGQLLEENHFEYGEPVYSAKNIMNDRGLVIESNRWQQDEGHSQTLTEYDSEGRRKEILHHNAAGKLVERAEFVYDEKGRIAELEEENVRSYKKTVFGYDENDNIIEQKEFDENDVLVSTVFRTFENKRIIQSEVTIMGAEENMTQKYLIKYEYGNC